MSVETSTNREELINQNELLLDHERVILKKYFNNKSHGVSNKETDPLQLATFGEPPTKLTSNVWVGNIYDAHSTALLGELRIQAMISVIDQWPNAVTVGIPYFLYPIGQPQNGEKWDDATKANVLSIGNAIEKLRTAGYTPIFINCLSGIDRAPTITWKYMVDKLKTTEDVARENVKRLRPVSIVHSEWF